MNKDLKVAIGILKDIVDYGSNENNCIYAEEAKALLDALESKERETSDDVSNKIEYWDEFIDDMENLTSERILDKYIIQRREG